MSQKISRPDFLAEDYAERAIARWEKVLVGVKGDYMRAATARLLDNQAYHNQTRYGAYLGEDNTQVGDIAVFTRLSFPLIRRIYPELVANELVSVQPISQPTAKIFYLDFHYGSDVAPLSRGDRNDYLADQGATIQQAYNYTKGFARGAAVGVGDGTTKEFQLPSPLTTPYLESTFTPVVDNDNLKIYVDAAPVTVVTSGTPGAGQVLVDPRTGAVEFNTAPAAAAVITADFDLKLRGDDSRIPEMTMSMTSDDVSAHARKLKVRWELEAEQDLRAYHGLSMETELMRVAGDEIRREIDREILNDLVASAAGNTNWQKLYESGAGDPGEGYTRREYEETLFHAILDAEAAIYKRRLVRANFVVTGPDVAARMEKINSFRLNGDLQGGQVVEGPHLFGTLSGRFRIVVDPLFPADKMLVGHRGGAFNQTGYVYAPYIGLIVTDRIMDTDFVPRRAMMRRDAKKLISGDFYQIVTLV